MKKPKQINAISYEDISNEEMKQILISSYSSSYGVIGSGSGSGSGSELPPKIRACIGKSERDDCEFYYLGHKQHGKCRYDRIVGSPWRGWLYCSNIR